MFYVIRKFSSIEKGKPFSYGYKVMEECEKIDDAIHYVQFYSKLLHDGCKSIMDAFASKYNLSLEEEGKEEFYTNRVTLETKNETAISLFYISRNYPIG